MHVAYCALLSSETSRYLYWSAYIPVCVIVKPALWNKILVFHFTDKLVLVLRYI